MKQLLDSECINSIVKRKTHREVKDLEEMTNIISQIYDDQWKYTLGAFIGRGKYRLQAWAKKKFEIPDEDWVDMEPQAKIDLARLFWKISLEETDYQFSNDNQWITGSRREQVAKKPHQMKGYQNERAYKIPFKNKKPASTQEGFNLIEEELDKEDFVLNTDVNNDLDVTDVVDTTQPKDHYLSPYLDAKKTSREEVEDADVFDSILSVSNDDNASINLSDEVDNVDFYSRHHNTCPKKRKRKTKGPTKVGSPSKKSKNARGRSIFDDDENVSLTLLLIFTLADT